MTVTNLRYVLSPDAKISQEIPVTSLQLSSYRSSLITADLIKRALFNPDIQTVTFYTTTMTKCEKIWTKIALLFIIPLSYLFSSLEETRLEYQSSSWLLYKMDPLSLVTLPQTTGAVASPTAGLSQKEKDARLHHAAEEGKIDEIDHLLKAGAFISSKNEEGETALHLAAKNNQGNAAEHLIIKGAKVDDIDSFGDTPLHSAAYNGALSTIQVLLRNGANISIKNSRGRIPLHDAATRGNEELVPLLANRENVNAEDENRNTPIHCAAYSGDLATFRALVIQGANIRAQNIRGETALDYAQSSNHVPLILYLVKELAKNKLEGTNAVLTKALFQILASAEIKDSLDLTKTLIESGVSCESVNKGQTVLDCAIANDRFEVIPYLIQELSKTKESSATLSTKVLHSVLKKKEVPLALIQELVKAGAKSDEADETGKTPLIKAVFGQHPTIVSFFLSELAKVKEEATLIAMRNQCLVEALNNPFVEMVKCLRESGAFIPEETTFSSNPLALAHKTLMSLKDKTAFLWHFLQLEKARIKNGIDYQNYLNHLLLEGTKDDMPTFLIEVLLKEGAKPDATDSSKRTPLHFAAMEGNPDTIQLLLTQGADKTATDAEGKTPLEVCNADDPSCPSLLKA